MDAKKAFDDYGGRVPDAAPPVDAPIVSNIPDITGDWFGVAAPPLSEPKYFYFRIHFDYTPVTANSGTLAWSAQPLDYTTMAPVGTPFVSSNIAVGSDATANIPMNGTLPGAANSVAGIDVQVNAVVHTTIRSADFQCGTLTGQAGPLALDGTTFAGQRITGSTLPSPIWMCQ